MSDTASASVTHQRDPASIEISNPTFFLRPNGDTTTLEFMVLDDQNVIIADGTPVYLSAMFGNISPANVTTLGGYFTAIFTSDATVGTATITAQTDNFVTATTEIDVGTPKVNQVALFGSTTQFPADGASSATLTATVLDRWGNPVVGQTVRIGVGGDSQIGMVNDGDTAVRAERSRSRCSRPAKPRFDYAQRVFVVKFPSIDILLRR